MNKMVYIETLSEARKYYYNIEERSIQYVKKSKKNTRKARISKENYKKRLTQNCICDSMKDALL